MFAGIRGACVETGDFPTGSSYKCCHEMRFGSPKCTKTRFCHLDPLHGEFAALPGPLAEFWERGEKGKSGAT